jgi:dihydrofolate synthase / folylpolyglutamate synthase
MNVRPIKTQVFKERHSLGDFIREAVPALKESSILAVTSKIVALAEGRVAETKDKERLIKEESEWALQTHPEWWWTKKDGALLVNAGIDDSNADGKLVLLPKDSFKTAAELRAQLISLYKVKSLGIVITDSRISPMRTGVTGLALGYAGFRGIRDYRGKRDIFGRELKVTVTDVADSIATAATLVMGEGAEKQPLAIIEGAPVEFVETVDRREVEIPPEEDMYAPLFRHQRR